MKRLLLIIFTWWNGQTFGTWLFTVRRGVRVGEDAMGNVYYRQSNGPRRWVIYNGLAEASKIPPEWHGWLHHTVDVPPSEEAYQERPWQKPHQPNLTGTPLAYRPQGSIVTPQRRPAATGDYQAWRPE